MPFKLSQRQEKHIKLSIDNSFVTDYLPFAPEDSVKVYLYGYSCACVGSECGIDTICQKLALSDAEVKNAFKYWASVGLINVLEEEPFTVEYLPLSQAMPPMRKFSKTKYADFNSQLHAMLPARNILPGEYNEYYTVIEDCHLEPEAMLAIIAYCIRLKGEDISVKYITTVARNIAQKNLLTYDRVNEELSQYDAYSPLTDKIMKALQSRKMPDHEDRNLVIKWTKTYSYTVDTIVFVAKKIVKKGGFDKLDRTLTKFYENRLQTIEEIEQFIANRDKTYELAREINRIIGVYYEQLDYIIETYISKWLSMGYTDQTLKTVAEYCFKHNVKSLDGMNETIERFYKKGVVSEESIAQYLSLSIATDNDIKEILSACGSTRIVTTRDRDSYRTWTYTWKMSKPLILYAASLATGAINPIAYINSLLSTWLNKGIDTVEKAKDDKIEPAQPQNTVKVEKTYTSEQLNAMFDNLNYEDM